MLWNPSIDKFYCSLVSRLSTPVFCILQAIKNCVGMRLFHCSRKQGISECFASSTGYGRVVLALVSFYYMPYDPVKATVFYLFSGLLDAFDGWAARKFNQGKTNRPVARGVGKGFDRTCRLKSQVPRSYTANSLHEYCKPYCESASHGRGQMKVCFTWKQRAESSGSAVQSMFQVATRDLADD